MRYNINMVRHEKIKSFAAPTEEDIEYFQSLPFEEQRALLETEIAKGFTGEPVAYNEALSKQIFDKALNSVTQKHAKN